MDTMFTPTLIPGTFNSRDLAGLTAPGGRLRPGHLIRSDAPVEPDGGRDAALAALGIVLAVDLRHPAERDHAPVELGVAGLRLVSRPLMGDDIAVHADASLEAIYDTLLDSRGAAFAAVIDEIANAHGPALFFCSAGKDRTGLVTAMLLSLLGVGDEEIVADFHRTEANVRGEFRARLERSAVASGLSEQQMAVKMGAPAELMRDVLARLARDGGVEAYLTRHGLPAEAPSALRAALLEP